MYKFILLLLLPSALMANEIDRLQTSKDVERFMIRHIDTSFKGEEIAGFYKLDLDGNGLTDLAISGHRLYVVMDLGEGKYDLHQLFTGGSFNEGSIFAIDSSDRLPRLVVKYEDFRKSIFDTVVLHLGEFMEYNRHPDSTIDFEELHFTAYGCYGNCPHYELSITHDGSMLYVPKAFNGKKRDIMARASAGEMDTLRSILGYMGLDRMDSIYSPGTVDAPDFSLEIRYRGKLKRIQDNDGPSTNSLAALYWKLFWIRHEFESE